MHPPPSRAIRRDGISWSRRISVLSLSFSHSCCEQAWSPDSRRWWSRSSFWQVFTSHFHDISSLPRLRCLYRCSLWRIAARRCTWNPQTPRRSSPGSTASSAGRWLSSHMGSLCAHRHSVRPPAHHAAWQRKNGTSPLALGTRLHHERSFCPSWQACHPRTHAPSAT